MPGPYNKQFFTAIEKVAPCDNATSNRTLFDVLQALNAEKDNQKFKKLLQKHATSLEVNIGDYELPDGDLLELNDDFLIVKLKKLKRKHAPADSGLPSFHEIRGLISTKLALFAEFNVEIEKINAWAQDDLDDLDALAKLTIDAGNIEPVLDALGLEPDDSNLTENECTLIIEAAKKKATELHKIVDAAKEKADAIGAAEAMKASLGTKHTDAKTNLGKAQTAKTETEDAFRKKEDEVSALRKEVEQNKVSFFSMNRREDASRLENIKHVLAIAARDLEEINIAYQRAAKKEQLAKDKVSEAEKLFADADAKLGEARAEPDNAKAAGMARDAEELYSKAIKASEEAELVIRQAEVEQGIAADPSSATLHHQRANLRIERHGFMGFTDKIKRKSDAADPAAVDTPGTGPIIAAKSEPEYKNVHLGIGDELHSTLKTAAGGEIRLVQTARGDVIDRSKPGSLTPEDKAKAAIRQAKMFLLNYDIKQGPIYIRNGSPEDINRVYAAVLLLLQNNPGLDIPISMIIPCADNCGPGMFESTSAYIDKHLGALSKKEQEEERKELVEERTDFKEKFNGIVVRDLPETPDDEEIKPTKLTKR